MLKLYPELFNILSIQYSMHPESVKEYFQNKIK